MAKWQLTLVQDGSVLRRYGGCSTDVKHELRSMLRAIDKHLKSTAHYTILVSRYTKTNRRKKIVQMVNGHVRPAPYYNVWCNSYDAPHCKKLLTHMGEKHGRSCS